MLATQSRTLLQFSEAERPLGERLLKLAAETDRVEGYRNPHAAEIARLAEKLGQRLGLRGIDLSALKFAALAHDLGERTMKRDYLLRAGGLTWEEQLDLWRHPIIGEQAAVDLKLPRLAQLLIRWHHEWWNGQGYPDGLAGTAIPLGARILRVVDTYCALLADRPHRGRQEPEQVEQFITDQAGLETDPHIVKEFLSLLAEEYPVSAPELYSPVQPVPESSETVDSEIEAAPVPAASVWDTNPGGTEAEAPAWTEIPQPVSGSHETTTSGLLAFEEAGDSALNLTPATSPPADVPSETAPAVPDAGMEAPGEPPPAAERLLETAEETELTELNVPAAEPALETAPLPPVPLVQPSPAEMAEIPAEQQNDSATPDPAAPNPVLPAEIADSLEIEVPDRLPEAELQIVALHEAPDYFWPVAQWIYEQWWATPDNSVQVVSEQLKEHLAGNSLPSTLIAVVDGQPVGSVSLLEHMVPGRADLTPCLAALFVLPEQRHRGVATQLLEAAYTKAKALGAARVFFAVPEQEDFFARRGWHVYEPALGAQALIVLHKP